MAAQAWDMTVARMAAPTTVQLMAVPARVTTAEPTAEPTAEQTAEQTAPLTAEPMVALTAEQTAPHSP